MTEAYDAPASVIAQAEVLHHALARINRRRELLDRFAAAKKAGRRG